MASMKSEIYSLLETDAQVTSAGQLGNTSLLGQSSAAPYGVYFRNPPEGIDLQSNTILTYYIASMVGRMPRTIYLHITAWGGNYEIVLSRVRTLLHEANLVCTDYQVLEIVWDWAGPESFDEFLRAYFWQNRYLIKAVPL